MNVTKVGTRCTMLTMHCVNWLTMNVCVCVCVCVCVHTVYPMYVGTAIRDIMGFFFLRIDETPSSSMNT